MRRTAARRLVLACTFVPPLAGCVGRPLPFAAGSSSEIALVSEPACAGTATFLRDALVAPSEALAEPLFRVHLDPESSRNWRTRPGIVLLGCLDANGPASRILAELLQPEELRRLRRVGAGRFARADVFARGQSLQIVAAVRAAALDSLVRAVAVDVRWALDSAAVARTGAALFGAGPVRVVGAAHGFQLQVPVFYRELPPAVGLQSAVEIVRSGPTRTLTVFWREGVDAVRARDVRFLLALQREFLAAAHGDTLGDHPVHVAPAMLANHPAMRLRGGWRNRTEVGGGPLCTWFVHDARRGRLYGVQALVFAPGRDKLPYLRELQVLAGTFRPEVPT